MTNWITVIATHSLTYLPVASANCPSRFGILSIILEECFGEFHLEATAYEHVLSDPLRQYS